MPQHFSDNLAQIAGHPVHTLRVPNIKNDTRSPLNRLNVILNEGRTIRVDSTQKRKCGAVGVEKTMSSHRLLRFVVLLSFGHGCLCECEKEKESQAEKLKEKLVCGYDKTEMPDKNAGPVITAKVSLKNIVHSTFDDYLWINTWIQISWTDKRLVWNPTDYNSVDSIEVSQDSVWLPQFVFDKEHTNTRTPERCTLSNTGIVNCTLVGEYYGTCQLKFKDFPFDTQNCTMQVDTAPSMQKVKFKPGAPNVATDKYQPHGEWTLKKVEPMKRPKSDTYDYLSYNFILERNSGLHMCSVVAPMIANAILILTTLFYNPEDKERIVLICLCFVLQFMYMEYFSWQFPNTGPEPPTLMLFYRDTLYMTCFVLILTAIERKVIKNKSVGPVWVSGIVALIANGPIGTLLFYFDAKDQGKSLGDEEEGIMDGENAKTNKDWFLFVKVVDKLCLFVYLLVLFIMLIALVP